MKMFVTKYGKRTVLSRVLCIALFAALLTGCGTSKKQDDKSSTPSPSQSAAKDPQFQDAAESNYNEPGTLPIVKKPITLSVGIRENGSITDYNDNAFTNWLAEQTGIRLEFTTYPGSGNEMQQKIDLAITAGQELPGIIINAALSDVQKNNYGASGILLDTREFLEKEAYYFNTETAKVANGDQIKEQVFLYGASPDGKIYGYPGLNESLTNMWGGRWYINNDWLKKLNLPYPTTTEELYTTLKAFKEKDPNGNGKADELPLVGSSSGWREQPEILILNSFLYTPYDFKLLNNGVVSLAYTQDAYREGLKYIHKLVSEELFNPISFTQDAAGLKALLDLPADQPTVVGMFAGSPTGSFAADNSKKLEYSGDFDIIKGPEGVAYTPYTPSWVGTSPTVITKYCEDPKAAMLLLDFMWSEEASIRLRYGEKGVNWDYADAGSRGLYESLGIKALFWQDNAVWGSTNNTIWAATDNAFLPTRISEGTEASKILNDPLASLGMIAKSVTHLVGHAPDEIMPKLVFTEDEITEFSDLETIISGYAGECRVRFMTGDMDINDDKVWNDYLKELDQGGLRRYIEIMQTAYDRMYK